MSLTRNIFDDLFFGRLSGCKRRPNVTDEVTALNEKIQDEKRYFAEKLSQEDYSRLVELETLYTQANSADEVDAFRHAFSMGVILMLGVFSDD